MVFNAVYYEGKSKYSFVKRFQVISASKREYIMSQKGIRVQNYYTLNLDQMESLKLFLFIFMLHRKLG